MPDVKLAFRALVRSPFVTGVAVLSLALGIGANAAIFSLFDQMLLRSLPVQEPERLVNLEAPGPKPGSQSCGMAGDCEAVFSYPMFRDLQEEQRSFTGLAAHVSIPVNLADGERTVNGEGLLVSGSYFPVLGVRPALGRLLDPGDDERVGEHSVVVLSHAHWQDHFGGDPGVLNSTLVVNGRPMTVVGVAAPGFRGTTLGVDPDVFVPLTMRGAMLPWWEGFEKRQSYWAYVFGRLRPGVSLEQADADLNAIYRGIVNEVEAPLQEGMSDATLERFRAKSILLDEGARGQSVVRGEVRTPMVLLFSITGVVLLIACANIANLLLARGAGRAQEMAIRGAMGARRGKLLGQLLTESVLLGLTGGVAGLLVAHWTLRGIGTVLPPESMTDITLSLSPGVVLFTALVSVGTGVLFGLYPALHATGHDLGETLKANSGKASGSRSGARFRTGLVTGQIALSLALLVGAGLFIKSLVNVSRVDLGIRSENVVTFQLAPSLNGYASQESLALFQRVEEELAALPGVDGASSAMVGLLAGSSWGTDVHVEGFESGPDIDNNSRLNEVGPRFFSTVGMPLLAGREFTEADGPGAPKVAVVNEAFARKFGLGRDAVGKWMSPRGEELDVQIVGLVQDAKYNEVKGDVPPLFFTPYRQDEDVSFLNFYVRTSLDPSETMRAVRGVVRELDPNLPVEGLKTLEAQARENVFMDRMIGTLAAAFAALATVLAAVGLYGVLAYAVAQRTREIGLRMALGARSGNVRAMVLRQVVRITAVGAVIGIVAALALGHFARSLLFGMEGNDPWVVVGVSGLLGLIALAAGFVPALRASRVDPMEALRYE